jgi:hypothetical protein
VTPSYVIDVPGTIFNGPARKSFTVLSVQTIPERLIAAE